MTHGRDPLTLPRHARNRAGPAAVPRWPAPNPLRYPLGLALVTAGAILLFAVSNIPYLNLKVVGLILLATGLTGLRIPQRAWRWARAHAGDLRAVLAQMASEPEPEAERVPLDTLLRPTVGQGCRAPVGQRDGVAPRGRW